MDINAIQEQNTKLICEIECLEEDLENTTKLMLKKARKVKKQKKKIRKMEKIIARLVEELENRKV